MFPAASADGAGSAGGPVRPPVGKAKADQLFQAGKEAIHKKDWSAAVDKWKNLSTLFPQSPWGAEPYYWLAYSLNQAAKESGDIEKQTAMREAGHDARSKRC